MREASESAFEGLELVFVKSRAARHEVTLIYERQGECWTATSPEIDRWMAIGDTFAEVRVLALEGVYYAAEDGRI